MLQALSDVYYLRSRVPLGRRADSKTPASRRTTIPLMSRDTLIPLLLAAGFTLGCIGIHSARRYTDTVTLVLVLLLGFVASLHVGRHAHVSGHRTAEHAGPNHNWIAELTYYPP